MSAACAAWREQWDIDGCVRFVLARGFTRVTLQFPDELQAHAADVAAALQAGCAAAGATVQAFVLADTTYQATAVDEVAALHVDAHCVVHYGRASLSALSRLPAYFVFGRAPAAPAALAAAVAAHAAGLAGARAVVVLLDQPLLWAAPALRAALDAAPPGPAGGGGGAAVVLADAAARQLEPGPRAAPPPGRTALAGYCWQLPAGVQADECAWLWVGEGDAPALAQLQLTAPDARWAALDAAGGALVEGLPAALRAALRRRRFLVEKARAASIVGILVGTLGAAGYREAVAAVRTLARRAGKRTYTVLVGKPSPAKLANFPEIEVFVLVADPQGHILDSKEYLAPVITPAEALAAFTGAPYTGAYSADFGAVLAAAAAPPEGPGDGKQPTGLALALAQGAGLSARGAGALAPAGSAAEFLATRRTWRGLETPLTGAPALAAAPAAAGRSGRAAGYDDEPGRH